MSDKPCEFFQAGQNLIDEINDLLIRANETNIAVAFVKKDGFEKIRDSLEEVLKQKRVVKIIIGASTDFMITDSDVLKELLQLKRKYRTLSVKFYNSVRFHPKLFIFKMNGETNIIIGSSNLTGGGTKNNIEANVLLKNSSEDVFARSVVGSFNIWFDGGEKLTAKIVHYYEKSKGEREKLNNKIKKKSPISETPIPARLRMEINYWKVAPGPRGWQWPLWCQEIINGKGKIAIGWGKGTKQGKIFYDEMKKGDIVVAYSRGIVFGIAKIISDAYSKRVKSLEPFHNLRDVEWIKLVEKRPPEKYIKILGTYDTVHLIEDEDTIYYINSLINI